MTAASNSKRVVILGAGFAGLYTALHLQKKLGKNAPVDITLIDQNHFHLFTPMLHEVATGMIELSLILTPIRRLMKGKGIRFLRARVEAINPEAQRVVLCRADQEPVPTFWSLPWVRSRTFMELIPSGSGRWR